MKNQERQGGLEGRRDDQQSGQPVQLEPETEKKNPQHSERETHKSGQHASPQREGQHQEPQHGGGMKK